MFHFFVAGKNKFLSVLLVTVFSFATDVYAADLSSVRQYLTFTTGASIARVGKQQQDVSAVPVNGSTQYLPSGKYRTGFLYGISGGYEFKIGANALASLGLGIYSNSNHVAKGQVWYRGSCCPAINVHRFNYNYNVKSTRLMLEGQIGWQFGSDKVRLIPFVLVGVGPSFNFANSYEETLVDPSASIQLGFDSKRKTNFAYQLGIGAALPFNFNHDRLSLSYRYVDLGKACFNARPDYPLYQMDVGRIRTNEIYISYTHLFNV